MGDYEEYKKKKGPKKSSGPLYPLNEEVIPSIEHSIHNPTTIPKDPFVVQNLDIISIPGCVWRPTSPPAEAPSRLPEEGEEAEGVLRLCRLQRLLHARGQADPERAKPRPNCET